MPIWLIEPRSDHANMVDKAGGRSHQIKARKVSRFRCTSAGSLQPCCLVDAQHDVHILDGCAGSAFAEVVKEGCDAGLVLVAADYDLEVPAKGNAGVRV